RLISEVFGKSRFSSEELQIAWARVAKQRFELTVVGSIGGMVEAEKVHVQRKRPVGVLSDHFPYLFHIARSPIRCHSHNLVFAFVDLKTEKSSKRAVEQTDRMRKLNLL